jgi:hypothetical protein
MTIDDLIAKLREHHAALGDGRDCRSQNEKAAWYAATTTTAGVTSTLRSLPDDIAHEEAQLRALEESRATVLEKRAAIEQLISDAPDPSTIANGRERDQEIERQRQLRLSLELLGAGRLLRAPGQHYPPLSYLDQRLAEVRDRRDRLQLQLDSAIAQAEALLGATVTS